MVDDSTVTYACRIFTWCRVFDGFDENFDGVLTRSQVDDFKCLFNNVGGFGFFACVFAWAHKAVYKSFHYVDFCFSKALMLMSSHAVWQRHWR